MTGRTFRSSFKEALCGPPGRFSLLLAHDRANARFLFGRER